MATRREEQIMGYLKTACEQISAGANYQFTQKLVTRKDRHITDINTAECPAVILSDPDVETEEVGANWTRNWLRTVLTGIVNSEDPEEDANKFGGDIRRAVVLESNAPHNQMTECGYTRVVSRSTNALDERTGIVDVEIEVFYTEEVGS